MWPQQQQQSKASNIDNAELVSDLVSARTRNVYAHGVQSPSGVSYPEEPRLYKSEVSSTGREPSSMKGYADSGSCLYDSGRTDSGFLSGANIASDQFLSSDDISASRKFTDSALQDPLPEEEEEEDKSCMRLDKVSSMRLDSGVDVNEQFSELSLSPTNDLNSGPTNDLNAPFSKSKSRDSASTTFSNIIPSSPSSKVSTQSQPSSEHNSQRQVQEKQLPVATPPWELYYQQDEDGDTQLHIAIIQGFIEVVYALIQMAPHHYLLDLVNHDCQSPLHLAVLTRQPRIVRRLVVAGARVDTRDRSGNTALHLACLNGDIDCMRALTVPVSVTEVNSAGLRYQVYQHHVPQDLEEKNYDGQMCIHLAALGGNVEILRHLVWCGANINAREGKSGRTALHLCVELGLIGVARFLLEELGAASGLQLEVATYAGYTAYQLAAAVDSALALQLRERGAIPRPLPDDEDDSDSEDEEMYQVPRDSGFSGLRMNGQPIDITA